MILDMPINLFPGKNCNKISTTSENNFGFITKNHCYENSSKRPL